MNTTLNIASIPWAPHFYNCEEPCRLGFGFDLMKLVLPGYSLRPLGNFTSFGISGEHNGSLINSILHGAAHMTPPIMYHNMNRAKNVQYLQPSFCTFPLGYLVNPQEEPTYLLFLKPFRISLWLLGIFVYFVTASHIVLCKNYEFTCQELLVQLYQLSFRQKATKLWKTHPEKIVVTVWSALAKLIVISYSNSFVASILPISTGSMASRFDTLEKVADKLNDGYSFVLFPDNALNPYLTNHHNIAIRNSVMKGLHAGPYTNDQIPTSKQLVNYTLHHKRIIMMDNVEVLLTEKNSLPPMENDASFVVSDQTLPVFPYYAVAKKGFMDNNMTRKMTRAIHHIREFGLVEKVSREYNIDYRTLNGHLSWSVPNVIRNPVDVELILKFLVVLFIGYPVAAIIFVLERRIVKV